MHSKLEFPIHKVRLKSHKIFTALYKSSRACLINVFKNFWFKFWILEVVCKKETEVEAIVKN